MRQIEKKLEREFIREFGKEEYEKLKNACRFHIEMGHIRKKYKGNFMQVLLITLGFECVKNKEYREFHGIKISWKKLKEWIRKHKEEINKCPVTPNDIDFLTLIAGDYEELGLFKR